MNVVAIVQARMASTRFPGKVLHGIAGRPMLWRVVERVRRTPSVTTVVVATSTMPADDAIADFCAGKSIECFRGSEADVLDRFYRAALRYAADVVVRITADCPLIDPEVSGRVLRSYLDGHYDYVSNTLVPTYPDGLDTEVFSFGALETAWREARLPAEREHVTPYMRQAARFRVFNVRHDGDLSALRWTVDEPADLELVGRVYATLGTAGLFTMGDVLKLLADEPGLGRLNEGALRNEGYYRSLAKEASMPPQQRSLVRSAEWEARAERVIPSCTQTFSKGRTQFVRGVAPTFLARGDGSHVWDVDGNEYIDYAMALGPIILGHAYPAVTDAAARQMREGITFSLPHPLEVEVAELLVDVVPCAEMVRFGKNGSDATSGAVRVARAFTGRDIIACCGYHGWQDWYIGTTTRNKGVPKAVQELTIPFQYNDIASLEKIFATHPGQVAAVIMEPVGIVAPVAGFLEDVRDLARREGALLIYDEVVTSFRMALGGAQEHFGVTPDLACVGKAMANGFPVAAIVGRRDVMEQFDEIFFSFTFGGEAVSLAAAKATITEMRRHDVVAHLWAQGEKLKNGVNVLAREFGLERQVECVGLSPRTVVTFKDEHRADSLLLKSLFQQESLKRGVLFTGGHNVCYSHSDHDIDQTLRVYRTAMEILADAIRNRDVEARLEGAAVEPVFRRA